MNKEEMEQVMAQQRKAERRRQSLGALMGCGAIIVGTALMVWLFMALGVY